MDPKAEPAFEVATIKPSDPNARGRLFAMRGGEVLTINTTVENLLSFAYNLHAGQIAGGPAWIRSDHFDITGKPDAPGSLNVDQFRSLIRKPLADRFQMKFHQEKKELAVYAITAPPRLKNKLIPNTSRAATGGLIFPRLGLLPARNSTMDEFAATIQSAVLDRPVVNQTNIEGRFDFTLIGRPMNTSSPPSARRRKRPNGTSPTSTKPFRSSSA
jgi:uncharacterized protein (TIGR03435 family)